MSAPSGGWVVYEWAAIRLVPRVHAEQFLNVGVMVHARSADFLEARVGVIWERLRHFAPGLDLDRIRSHLDTYVRICHGDASAGEIALLPPSERFHWLTHPRSGVLQTSTPHPGRCHDPAAALERLYAEQCSLGR